MKETNTGHESDDPTRSVGVMSPTEVLSSTDACPRGEERLHQLNDVADGLRQVMQRWQDRLTFEGLALPEKYSEGRINVSLEFDWLASGETYRAEYSVRPNLYREAMDSSAAASHFIYEDRNYLEMRDQKDVFVVDVETVKGVDGVIPSLVWFYRVGEKSDGISKSLQYSLFQRGYKFVPIYGEWKFGPLGWSFPKFCDEFAPRKVQGRPEVMDSVARNAGNFRRGTLDLLDFEKIISGVFVTLNIQTAKVRLNEGIQRIIKLRDVTVGPFDL